MEHEVVSRDAWLVARRVLLDEEKALTHARERVAEKRRSLPWVKIDKAYTFTGRDGIATLEDLFKAKSQLVIYHLMFGADWEKPCPGCTAWANAFNGTTQYLAAADARLIAMSHAPYEKLAPVAAEYGWTFAWYSAADGDFNYDFYASSHDTSRDSTRRIGDDQGESVHFDRGENHGVSVFFKNDEGEVFHTYSTYNRGIEEMNGALGYFDVLPKGRVS